ncbi:hypothetical protein H5410_013445 [Solanum commersonii]|uniref:Cullin family profile domain-containing protein n=1 Tax=Solanum commersonii TaxID=4109 RepID=A0A9J6AVE6_SOLCO|nr:hypothetical protein H5410_013445 [Solanum commersonii]
MAQLNLSDDDVVRLLHSLLCAKYKILNKESSSKTIFPTDVFEFNSKFTDKMRRIKVQLMMSKIPIPPVDEKKKVIEDVDKDRQYAIDASSSGGGGLSGSKLFDHPFSKFLRSLVTSQVVSAAHYCTLVKLSRSPHFEALKPKYSGPYFKDKAKFVTFPTSDFDIEITMNQYSTIDLEHGWDFIQRGITKLKNILEGLPEPQLSSKDYMKLCTLLTGEFTTCVLRRPHMIINLNSFMTNIVKLLKNISQQRHVNKEGLVWVEDLSRLYRLFSKIPRGLDPVAIILKQHVTAEGTALVKQAEDAASNKKFVLLMSFVQRFLVNIISSLLYQKHEVTKFDFHLNDCFVSFTSFVLQYMIIDNLVVGNVTSKRCVLQQANKRDVVGLQEQVFVRKVIELHDKYLAYVNNCFQYCTLFHKSICFFFVPLEQEKADNRSHLQVVKLLAYISDKDLFADFYRKKLSRQLLFDKSANDEHERSILTKLKQQCGGEFTSKMEGMVTDLTLARENQASFEEYLSNNLIANLGIDLTVTVLTSGFWPSYKSFDLNLPAEMVRCVEVFNEFYQTKTKQRKLTWIYSLGTCNINGKFESKTIELVVTTYQASALLLFNASDRLSYQEIMTQLNLSDDDVVRLLHSLSCAKYKILNKEPSTKIISPTDVFEFNSKFTDKMRRIKIPLPPGDEKKKVIEDVDKDRRYAIDASIVRIMKSRKVLGYQQLVLECVEQLGRMFKPDVKAIKKRIKDLITRDLPREGQR